MTDSYFIKSGTIQHPLLLYIKECCKKGNTGFEKIYSSSPSDIKYITTGIKFSEFTSGPDVLVDSIRNLNCGTLSNDYLIDSFIDVENYALIRLDSSNNLYSLLTYTFNATNNCIEVIGFCSKVGGGTIFNFFMNAVKCAFADMIKYDPDSAAQLKHEIKLNSLLDPPTLNFYFKFGFEDDGRPGYLRPLRRQVSEQTEPEEEEDEHITLANTLSKLFGFTIKYHDYELRQNPKRSRRYGEPYVISSTDDAVVRAYASDDSDYVPSDPDDSDDDIKPTRKRSRGGKTKKYKRNKKISNKQTAGSKKISRKMSKKTKRNKKISKNMSKKTKRNKKISKHKYF